VTAFGDRVNTAELFLSPRFRAPEQAIIQDSPIRFIAIDRRLSTGLPLVGVYFEQGEPDSFRHAAPVALATLTKLDGAENLDRIFDTGDIALYDAGALLDAR
jgi:hypothetical protein